MDQYFVFMEVSEFDLYSYLSEIFVHSFSSGSDNSFKESDFKNRCVFYFCDVHFLMGIALK